MVARLETGGIILVAAGLAGLVLAGCGGHTTSTTSLEVSSSSPAHGASAVAVNSAVVVTFSAAVDPSTATTGAIKLAAGGSDVPGAVSVSGRRATIRPAVDLAPSTVHTVTLSAGIADIDGEILSADHRFSFTTGKALDTTAPAVLSTVPADKATGVAPAAVVLVTFSERMDPTTVNAASFMLAAGGATVAASVACAGNTAALTPLASLQEHTTYTATLKTAARDLAGNALASAVSWSFSTSDDTAPNVIKTSPGAGDAKVSPTVAVSATFSEELSSSTVSSSTFTLKDALGSISAGVSYSNKVAILTPADPLHLATKITATLTTGVEDLFGNSMNAPHSWSFTTRDGVWGKPTVLESSSIFLEKPRLSMNDKGDAVAVWYRIDSGSHHHLHGSVYTVATGWSSPLQLDSENYDAMNPRVALSNTGKAMVVWSGGVGVTTTIYTPGVGWSTPAVVGGVGFFPDAAINSSGDAIITWREKNSAGKWSIHTRRHGSTGWAPDRTVFSSPTVNTNESRVELDDGGAAIIVFGTWDSATFSLYQLFAYHENKSGNVTGKMVLDSGTQYPFGGAYLPGFRFAMSSKGHGLATWNGADGKNGCAALARYFTFGTGWGAKVPLESESSYGSVFPAINQEGQAVVVWTRLSLASAHLMADRYQPGKGWSGAEIVKVSSSIKPRAAIDRMGHTMVVDGYSANRHVVGKGWTSTLNLIPAGSLPGAPVALDVRGRGLAVYSKFNKSQYTIYANRFQ